MPSPEERYVTRLLEERFRVALRRIRESELKEPDYELLESGRRAAVVEIKHIRREPRTPKNGWRPDPSGFWMTRNGDKGPSRIGAKIHEAYKQLSRYSEPKILVFLNDDNLDVHDLEDAFSGGTFYGDASFGYWNVASASVAFGRIREEKTTIDLYVWIDRLRNATLSIRFQSTSGHELASRFFGCPTDIIPPSNLERTNSSTLGETLRALASTFAHREEK